MRRIVQRLIIVMTLSHLAVVVAQLAQGENASALAIGLGAAGLGAAGLGAAGLGAVSIGAIVLGTVLVARYSSTLLRSRSLTVGARARQHRESLTTMPEPKHPNTDGRVRARAPGGWLTAA
ncbi:MAG: hypothetical protein ACOH1T_03910 [Microbacteriaceae bacterium]